MPSIEAKIGPLPTTTGYWGRMRKEVVVEKKKKGKK